MMTAPQANQSADCTESNADTWSVVMLSVPGAIDPKKLMAKPARNNFRFFVMFLPKLK